MKYIKEDHRGYPRLQLYDDVNFDEFYRVSDILEKKLGVRFYEKVDDFDSLYWSFKFDGGDLILHYNVFLGISIFPSFAEAFSQQDEKALQVLIEQLPVFLI